MIRRVLIGCEESQTECLAFRSAGIEAYSCDLLPCSGGFPEWHIQDDVRNVWNDGFDLIILHPPCTFLSNAGASRLRVNGLIQRSRELDGLRARDFFLECLDAPAPHVCIENPSPSRYWNLPPCSQYIEPYMFGDPYKKRTLLWLRGLPCLMATNIVVPEWRWVNATNHCSGVRSDPLPGLHNSAFMRSKSFPGLARAMVDQWVFENYF